MLLSCSLVCQPFHPWKESLASFVQRFCVEWVELTHKHRLDNASLTSENMDCAEVDTKRRTVTARCLKQVREKLGYSASTWPVICCAIGHRVTFSLHCLRGYAHVLPFDWCNW